MHKLILVFFASIIGHSVSTNSGPILETHIGKFEGRTFEFDEDRQVDAFYGIPFARPPIKERRFEVYT
jgi:hypothetical protein